MPVAFCPATTSLDPQNLALPTVLLAGLLDGINPCAIGVLIFLLGYLVVFAQKPERVLKTGLVYAGAVFATYFLIGLFFYSFLATMMATPTFRGAGQFLRWALGGLLVFVGAVSIKDVFWPGRGFSFEISNSFRPRLQSLVERASLPATAALAVLVTLLETPCSFPLYAGAVGVLSQCNFSALKLGAYLLLYNFLFVLPLLVIVLLVWGGVGMSVLKEWEHKHKNTMKLATGILVALLGVSLFVL